MVKGINDGPRISQDFGNTGVQNTKAEKTPHKPMSLGELNGALGELGLPTFGTSRETPVRRGTADQAPRQDGAVRNRSNEAKDFFKSVGREIGGFLAKIGNAFKTGFEAIKQAVTNRAGAANQVQTPPTTEVETPPPPPPLDRQGGVLKDYCTDLISTLEADYQTYMTTSQDDPKLTRQEFVEAQLPDPPGGRQGIDSQSMSFIGDRIDDVRANLKTPANNDLASMQTAVMDRLADMPTLDISTPMLFGKEMDRFDKQATTFLRGNSAYTRADKYMAMDSIPFGKVATDVMDSVSDFIREDGHLGITEAGDMQVAQMTPEQATAVERVCDGVLDRLLDIDPNTEGSLFNSIPQDYRDHLSDKANQILERPGTASLDERKAAVKMMYANSVFLRGLVGDLSDQVGKTEGANRVFLGRSMNLFQSLLNGASGSFIERSNGSSGEVMRNISATHSPRLEAFMQAIGMPVVDDDQADTL